MKPTSAIPWHKYVPIADAPAYAQLGWVAAREAMPVPHGIYRILMSFEGDGPPIEPAASHMEPNPRRTAMDLNQMITAIGKMGDELTDMATSLVMDGQLTDSDKETLLGAIQELREPIQQLTDLVYGEDEEASR